VAFYDSVPPEINDKEADSQYHRDLGLPCRVAINTGKLISLLEEISGTSLPSTPSMMIPPYKLFVTHWDDIQAKASLLESTFKEKYDKTVEEYMLEPESKEKKEEGPLDEKATAKKEEQDTAKSTILQMRCLAKFLRTHFQGLVNLRQQIKDRTLEKISFDNLWHLFSPGDIIVGKEPIGKRYQAYQVFCVTGGRYTVKGAGHVSSDKDGSSAVLSRNQLKLLCFCLDYDGSSLGAREETVHIRPYPGEKKITDLDFFPKDFCGSEDEVVTSLVERGKKFLDCRFGHGSYDGMASKYDLERVEGEVFVDFKSGYEYQSGWREAFGTLGTMKTPSWGNEETHEPRCLSSSCTSCGTFNFDDEQIDVKRTEAFRKSPKFPGLIEEDKIKDLAENHLILLPQNLLAYALRSKKWRK
jgi:hypothetical protein